MASPDIAEIQALDGILDELDYYQVLELERDAPSSEIRRAYHRASRRFHPDVHRQLGADLRPPVERIAKRVAEAYSVLRDPRRRRVYDGQIADAAARVRLPLVEAEAVADRERRETHEGRTPNGRRYFAMVQADIARGDPTAAIRNLKTALAFEPDNAHFKSKLAELERR